MSPLPNDEDPEALAERILARFCDEGLSSISLRPEVKTELALEARPAVHALLFGLGTDRAGDASSLEHHESLAMVTLLGRALALSGATPTPVLRVVPALLTSQDGMRIAADPTHVQTFDAIYSRSARPGDRDRRARSNPVQPGTIPLRIGR